MSVHPSPKNLARDVVRQMWPKRQPRRPKAPARFTAAAKAVMDARSGGTCEICGQRRIAEHHHRGATSMGGSRIEWVNQPANGLAVCHECHMRAEGTLTGSSRRVSKDNGWLVSRNGLLRAEEVPVLYRGRWVNLTDDGAVHPIGGAA